MKYSSVLALLSVTLFLNCGTNKAKEKDDSEGEPAPKVYTKFTGNYNKAFNDLPDLHIAAATENGVGPLVVRGDTLLYCDQLKRIPQELEVYRVDELKHSIPFLVPKASALLSDISVNFRDSLISKKMPIYKLIVTSVTRTNDDVKRLARGNKNASDNSVHRYGTTIDIAWTRFDKVNLSDSRTLDDGRLKAVLGQVLHDLRERDRCYIKHERKQACFHITVR